MTGASRGIGRAIALQLAEHGALVAASYNTDHAAAHRLWKDLAELGGDHLVVQADVTDAGAARRMVGLAVERFEEIDILINNAGVISHRKLEQLAPDEWRRVVDTNLTGTYLVTREAVHHMPEAGSIVNVTSAVATRGMPAAAHSARRRGRPHRLDTGTVQGTGTAVASASTLLLQASSTPIRRRG